MTLSPITRSAIVLALFLLLITGGASASSGIQAVLGETVPLAGYCYGSQWAYLYLTGPNLPENGVPLDDVSERADQGYFTKVSVDGNNYWSYKWNTADVGGKLDEGTYTIYVVNGPNDRSRLAQADYVTISVTLGQPSISAASVQQQYGALEITSVPSGARVTVNNQYRGTTPLSLPDISPGTYQIGFSHTGYYEFNTPVRVESGRTSEVKATLEPLPAPTTVVATPTTVQTAPVTVPVSSTPTQKAAGILPAMILAGALLIACIHRRHR